MKYEIFIVDPVIKSDCSNKEKVILRVFPHEWENRKEQWIAHRDALNGEIKTKEFARKCEVKSITRKQMDEFCDKYHIQGSNGSSVVAFGIFKNDELLGAMSIGRHPRRSYVFILDRLCFKHHVHVVGGASRLFKRCIEWSKNNGHKEIVSFSDNRYSFGRIYEKLGFVKDKELNSDYFYLKKDNFLEFHSKHSQKKSSTKCPENISEHEWALERGLIRVWDYGKIRWVYSISQEVTEKKKMCSLCKNHLPLNMFCAHRREPDGLCGWCKSCKSKKDKEYQIKNKDKIRVKNHDYYLSNMEKIKETTVKYRKANPDKIVIWGKTAELNIKEEIMSHYCEGGIIKCAKCPENDIRLLTIDHINGGGNKHREESKCGFSSTMCFWLKRNNFPEGFQILCWDCNWRKRYEEMKPDGVLSKTQKTTAEYVKKVKQEVLSHYGSTCPCGQSDPILLTLDHVNDDGAEHRKEVGGGFNFYMYLRRHSFPQYPPLQVLCITCQFRKKVGIPIPLKV